MCSGGGSPRTGNNKGETYSFVKTSFAKMLNKFVTFVVLSNVWLS